MHRARRAATLPLEHSSPLVLSERRANMAHAAARTSHTQLTARRATTAAAAVPARPPLASRLILPPLLLGRQLFNGYRNYNP